METRLAENPFATKRCPACRTHKSASEFSKSGKAKDGLQYYCKPCAGSQAKKRNGWRRQQYRTAHYRKQKYGIDEEQFDNMLEAQNGVCAICKRLPEDLPGKVKTFCVDHDHATGEVRGILCQPCNRALGIFEDDTVRMQIAIDYLKGSG